MMPTLPTLGQPCIGIWDAVDGDNAQPQHEGDQNGVQPQHDGDGNNAQLQHEAQQTCIYWAGTWVGNGPYW